MSIESIPLPKTVLIDSRDRDYASWPKSSNYRIKLPSIYKNVSSCQLLSAEIPSTFYIFNASQNNTTIRIRLSASGGDEVRDITLSDGNYGATTISNTLRDAINAAFANIGATFTVDINRSTLKCTIACTAPVGRVVSIDTSYIESEKPTEWGLAYYLGFIKGQVTSGVGAVTSPGVVSLNPVSYILLTMDPLDRVEETGLYGLQNAGRVFAKIPISVNSFDYVYFDKIISKNEFFPPIASLSQVTLKFQYHDGTEVDFNGAEHSMTLEILCTETRATA